MSFCRVEVFESNDREREQTREILRSMFIISYIGTKPKLNSKHGMNSPAIEA